MSVIIVMLIKLVMRKMTIISDDKVIIIINNNKKNNKSTFRLPAYPATIISTAGSPTKAPTHSSPPEAPPPLPLATRDSSSVFLSTTMETSGILCKLCCVVILAVTYGVFLVLWCGARATKMLEMVVAWEAEGSDTTVPPAQAVPEAEEEAAHAKALSAQEKQKVAEDSTCCVRHSLHMPRRYAQRLLGPAAENLEKWKAMYDVQMFLDLARRRVHIKGHKADVLVVVDAMKAWKASEAAAADE